MIQFIGATGGRIAFRKERKVMKVKRNKTRMNRVARDIFEGLTELRDAVRR